MNKQITEKNKVTANFNQNGELDEITVTDEKGTLTIKEKKNRHELKNNGLDKSVDVGYGMNVDIMK